jgi:hypothetical protein
MSAFAHAPPSSDAVAPASGKNDVDSSPGTGSAIAAMVAQEMAHGSSGRALDTATRSKMEGAFGADFSSVRVHTDGVAIGAAQQIGAAAFAQGADIYFDAGKYDPGSEEGERLIAHELAHVVQTGGTGAAVQPRATSGVSAPGDAAEAAADVAADRVVKGQPVGEIGTARPQTIHRDAIGDLRSAADGNWLGQVDDGRVLARARALSPAEKTAIRTGEQYDSLNRRIMRKLSTGNCLEYFNIIGGWDLRWKLYWLNEGGRLDELGAAQWQWLLGYASPQTMDLLRQYPHGYRAFLRNAPLEMIPPWDRLQGLEDGTWSGTPTDVRNAVVNLNPEQKARVRADDGKMRRIMQACGDSNERFRVVTYLELKVKWAVFYLNTVNALSSLTQHQWSQLLSECSRQDYDELVGWGEMWALVQRYCPAAVLQVTRQNSDPATAARAFDDPVQIDTMFATLGAAGFLAAATREPDLGTIDDIYGKVQARNKVHPVIDGLPTGARMGAETKRNLRKWFFTPKSTDAECKKMFEHRFRVQTDGAGSVNHVGEMQGDGVTPVNIQPFTKAGLTRMWKVCEALPPAAVENNPHLLFILRDANGGPGNAYYAGNGTGQQGDILMGYRNDAQLARQVGDSQDDIYQAGALGPGSPRMNMSRFSATLRHEIGHAVDSQLRISDSWCQQEVAGNWIKYSSYAEFVDAIIAAAGGLRYGDRATNDKYRAAMIDAVTNHRNFANVCAAHGITPPVADPGGPVSTVWTTDRWSTANLGPWYNHNWVPQGGRNFHDAYGNSGSLYSFRADVRAARKVTDYQWRAPGEWFAEVYQVYYSEQEAGPDVPVGARLRSKDPEAAQLISQRVDRGYSPQQMSDGTVTRAPGT